MLVDPKVFKYVNTLGRKIDDLLQERSNSKFVGVVTVNNRPASNAEVLIEDGKNYYQTTTDENGYFTVNILPGKYRIRIKQNGFGYNGNIDVVSEVDHQYFELKRKMEKVSPVDVLEESIAFVSQMEKEIKNLEKNVSELEHQQKVLKEQVDEVITTIYIYISQCEALEEKIIQAILISEKNISESLSNTSKEVKDLLNKLFSIQIRAFEMYEKALPPGESPPALPAPQDNYEIPEDVMKQLIFIVFNTKREIQNCVENINQYSMQVYELIRQMHKNPDEIYKTAMKIVNRMYGILEYMEDVVNNAEKRIMEIV